jgi:Zn-finger nucleic acid-binding protein
MRCPRCSAPLTQVRRAGIAIDICPGCRGVWLDRGELARIATRLWQLQHEWIPNDEISEPAIRWGRPPRYPRRYLRRRRRGADAQR